MSTWLDRLRKGRRDKVVQGYSSTVEFRIGEALQSGRPHLDLSRISLYELPDTIAELTKLESLDLSRNQLTALPEAIGHLSSLRELNLERNELESLPDSIGRLNRLEILNLAANALTSLPESIGQLCELDSLELNKNQLSELPESIGYLTKLCNLILDKNQLTMLPDSIGSLSMLKELDVSHQFLKLLPDSIGNMTALQSLNLQGNRLVSLPDSIGNMKQLRSLNVSDNLLTSLPESIGGATELQRLAVASNKLTHLPRSLGSLGELKELYLHGNSDLGLPAELLGRTLQEVNNWTGLATPPGDILNYYSRLQKGQSALNEAKLILVGRGGVGKTSIVNRLLYNTFAQEKKTEGIKITQWQLTLNRKEEVRLNIWDFGGQEIMHATHQFFLTRRSLYLLVLNGREGGEDADAEYWLKLIESFGAGSPVIIVLNKIKDHPFDLNRRALKQKYPVIRDFIKTDCKEGIGIEDLSKAVKRETDRLEHLRDAFPANWFTIKNHLAAMAPNFIRFDEYRAICNRHGERDEKAQEELAAYLHSLGIVLNYRDDPRLQDTHVLSPHWVTNGIYKIINCEELEKNNGEIDIRDLSKILDADKYPPSMHRFLFDLMKKFDLCFSFPHDETHYLIPELLDKQEPAEAAEFMPEDCLCFQYHYPVLPEGLLPRLIVRTHALSEGLSRWRSGVVLEFEGCKALVKADVQDRKVSILVSGERSAQRRLLAVIRSDFERIHRDIRNLQPREMVPLPTRPNVVIPYEKLLGMERHGVKRFLEFANGEVIEVDAQQLLNGVDLEGIRRTDSMERKAEALRLFISYSHKDEARRNELEAHLKLLQRRGFIETWHDRQIEAGDDWKQTIDENLERANIVLLLISSDFIASDYCYQKEMTRALELHEREIMQVVPVIVRDVNWRGAPFSHLQALPKDAKAVELWKRKDSAWKNVSEGIERIISDIRTLSAR